MILLFCMLVLDPGKTAFTVTVGSIENPYHTMAFSTMPETSLNMHINPRSLVVSVRDEQGRALSVKDGGWRWEGRKEPGHYPLTVVAGATGETMTLQLLVLEPLKTDAKGMMNGYQIGAYPDIPLRDLEVYKKPKGLLRVDPALAKLQISPHFKLGQFLCKQKGDYPKYLLVRSMLLIKLEFLLEKVNQSGVETDGFAVMSGYRTPFYNKAIGNVKYSRHQWGGAADIYIDVAPKDGRMDDLNKDGVSDVYDAAWLYNLIDDASFHGEFKPLIGGLGQYKKTSSHGPFVHVDVRGFKARWGH